MKKISTSELLRRVDAGDAYANIAKDYGITRQAVYKRVIALRGKTTKAIISGKVGKAVDQKLDAIDQLQKINDNANEILDLLMRWNRGDKLALQILESNVKRVKFGKDGEELDVKEVKFKDPRELAIKAMAEIRNQLKLQLEIFQCLYDLKAAEEFQQEVLQSIKEAAPDVQKKIIARLNSRRAIRAAVQFT